jgi:transcriptional antiterminator RfaH
VRNTQSWYAIYTNPKQEERVNLNLRLKSLETCYPMVREHSRPSYGKPVYVSKPLFPRYVFARFEVNSFLSKVRYTRGVHSIVSIGHDPAPVDDEVINTIQLRIGQNGFVKTEEELASGDRIMIQDGSLKGLVGIFERGIKASDRVMILLTAINYQSHLIIERDRIKKLS